MRYHFKYKSREEEVLINKLSSSSLISRDALIEIKKTYSELPYHNFLHALKVASYVLKLSPIDFNILEVKSMFYAALLHDSLHDWTPHLLDEVNSFFKWMSLIKTFQDKYDIWYVDSAIFRDSIIWTVFKNRWKYESRYSIVMGDLDIWIVWEDVFTYCYFWGLSLADEFWMSPEDWVTDYEFFKWLIKQDKNIFISNEVRKKLPNAYKTMKNFMLMDRQKKMDMYYVLKKEDLTFDEFKEKFKN